MLNNARNHIEIRKKELILTRIFKFLREGKVDEHPTLPIRSSEPERNRAGGNVLLGRA